MPRGFLFSKNHIVYVLRRCISIETGSVVCVIYLFSVVIVSSQSHPQLLFTRAFRQMSDKPYFPFIRNFRLRHNKHNFCSKIMSVNDKVKVIWKTNCQWKDRPHWPKRKEIKLVDAENEENVYPPLKSGDMVKVTFGSRWYNAEVVENWDPKAKKGKYYTFVSDDRLGAVPLLL